MTLCGEGGKNIPQPKPQELRREISRNVVGNKEIIEVEFYELDLFSTQDLRELYDFFQENDDALQHWLFSDFYGEPYSINIDRCINSLEVYFKGIDESGDEDDKETTTYDAFKTILEKITKWRGFSVYVGGVDLE